MTPFRRMIKYHIDMKQPRPILLFYANKTSDEIAYSDVFDQAQKELGIKTIYTLTDQTKVPRDWLSRGPDGTWMHRTGRIDANMILDAVPDFKERIFYLSGPHVMVSAYKETLKGMGVNEKQIKIDFFPGFA